MKIIFEADSGMDSSTAKVITHPATREHWTGMEEAIRNAEKKIVVINAKNDRNTQIPLSSIAAIESEDRMCNIRVITVGSSHDESINYCLAAGNAAAVRDPAYYCFLCLRQNGQ
ncbi:hypothetical protein J7E73_14855 [Paenibacillus albidus]|uniref:hypothetical protein n=1 Tax=Paenibacillus albidus TaxID=2041023 RepID=UPI001BECE07D|nr:hypothetical protein [Paenibacillus albidus]MBT2290398.1 hypothetical protein [Paenibacillus albidus]